MLAQGMAGPWISAPTPLSSQMCAEVGGEAVAEIDHGRGEAFLQKASAHFDSGDRVEVAGKIGRPQFLSGEQ